MGKVCACTDALSSSFKFRSDIQDAEVFAREVYLLMMSCMFQEVVDQESPPSPHLV